MRYHPDSASKPKRVTLDAPAALRPRASDPELRSSTSRRRRASPAITLLKAAGSRVTTSRVAIIEMLIERATPLSAVEILEALGKSAPDRVTVYRTLSALASSGVTHEVLSFDRVRRYAIAQQSSAVTVRFRCTQCDATSTRPALLPELMLFDGCLITRQSLEVEGRCGECR